MNIRNQERGFSLIEVIILIAILGSIMKMASFSLANVFNNKSAYEEAEILLGALYYSRVEAQTIDGCATVSATANSITTTVYLDCGPPLAKQKSTETFNFTKLVITPFSTGDPLTFLSNGGTSEALPSELVINDIKGNAYKYVIYPAIGSIRKKSL